MIEVGYLRETICNVMDKIPEEIQISASGLLNLGAEKNSGTYESLEGPEEFFSGVD